jgi:hypothetical protein
MHTQSNITNMKYHTKTLFSDHQNSVKTSPKSRKWHFRESKFKNFLGPSFQAPNKKELPMALHASVICLCLNYVYFCKLHLHFPVSKHLHGLVCHEIFGNFIRHSEIFGLHPPTIHASYGPACRRPVAR